MKHNEVSEVVLRVAIDIHKSIGSGLFEKVYESILFHELTETYNLKVERQIYLPVIWKGVTLEKAYKADLIIEEKVLIEIKSVDRIIEMHKMQVLTYLKLCNLKLGVILNFNSELMKQGIHRVINGNLD